MTPTKRAKHEDTAAGRVQVSLRLTDDVFRYLNSVSALSGESPARITEQALWEYLPAYMNRVLERRATVDEVVASAKKTGGKAKKGK